MSSNSSNSSTGGGNTKTPPSPKKKQISPAKNWCFTLNNYTDDELNMFSSIVPIKCDKAIIGKEIGDKGTPHLQGFLRFKVKCRPMGLFSDCNRIHFEKTKGTIHENYEYCSKDGDIFINIGFPKPLKTLACENNMYPYQEKILKFIEEEPDERTIYWISGYTGNEGKTTFCKYLVRFHNAIMLGGKSADMKNGIIEYKKTNGCTPELILINLPRSFNKDYISYTGIEEIKDMLFYSGKYEGGMIDGNCPHLIIFANQQPDWKLLSPDRWALYNINDKYDLYEVKI